jgi:hypothetical protein
MFVEILGTFFLLFVVFLVRYLWLIPTRTMKYYEKQFKASKYNIKVRPYNLFYNGFDNPLIEGIKNGNPFEYQQR